jgi:NAD(P)-dependent dehydrogenase (short-subunit alcohol dehydrogenase family)
MDLQGKVAIVTGAGGGGSGRAIARRLARGGVAVVVTDLNELGGLDTVRRIEVEGGRATFYRADVRAETDMKRLFTFTEKAYGGLDILVNNASTFTPQLLERWAEIVQTDLLGSMFAILHAIPAMRKRGGGAIVSMASTSALGHGPGRSPAYQAAKAGIIRMTPTLACLREQENIRVNCLVPHWIATEELTAFVAGATPEQRQEWNVPDVLIPTEEIADAVAELATNESLAGRVMICRGGQPWRLIPVGDPGYAALDEYRARRG